MSRGRGKCVTRGGTSTPPSTYLTFKWKRLHFIGMSNRDKARSKADVLQGTLDLMVLQTLATLGSKHGYAIAARLEQVSAGALRLNMGTLYPGLMRLEQRGLVRGKWGVTDNNRKARFYAITPAGTRQPMSQKFVCATCLISGSDEPVNRTKVASRYARS